MSGNHNKYQCEVINKPSFKGGICERCLKHVSQVEGDCHTCTPTNGWRDLERELAQHQAVIEEQTALIKRLREEITYLLHGSKR